MSEPEVILKLRLKIGDHELEVQGPPDRVGEHVAAFRDLMREFSSLLPSLPPSRPSSEQAEEPGPLAKLVRYDPRSRIISLRALPEGGQPEADALLVLLLAYQQMRGDDEVLVTLLKEALRQSGCPVARLDRAVSAHLREHMIVKSGTGKGGRYRLTNKGLGRAEELARQMIGPAG